MSYPGIYQQQALGGFTGANLAQYQDLLNSQAQAWQPSFVTNIGTITAAAVAAATTNVVVFPEPKRALAPTECTEFVWLRNRVNEILWRA